MSSSFSYSLKEHNSFGIDASCRLLTHVSSEEELNDALNSDSDHFILGGGSNLLLSGDLDKHVLKIEIPEINVIDEGSEFCVVEVGAGVNWHSFVLWAIQQGLGGIENLSLIPGTVGASPIQNIGAYGVELVDVFHSLTALDLATGAMREFNSEQCQFDYRNSIFKQEAKGKFIITKVRFNLTRKHELNTSYGAIAQKLTELDITQPSIRDISNAVIQIRQSKLPDPAEIGNSGSFFKNPIINTESFEELKSSFDDLKYYDLGDGNYKIPAGWMIDRLGWKGYRKGDAGVHKNQALVLVNYGNATGREILELSEEIQASVLDKFGIELNAEVNVL